MLAVLLCCLLAAVARSLPNQPQNPITIPLRPSLDTFDYIIQSSYHNASTSKITKHRYVSSLITKHKLEKRWTTPMYMHGMRVHSAELWIGTPPQKVDVVIDTGATALWVASADLQGDYCQRHRCYNASSSESVRVIEPSDTAFVAQFADGSAVSGPLFAETVGMAGLMALNQEFSPANILSPSVPVVGVLGLAPAKGNKEALPFIENAFKSASQRFHGEYTVGLYYHEKNSGITMGGTDTTKYRPETLERIPIGQPGKWIIGEVEVQVNKRTLGLNRFQAIIDTGTTITYGPPIAIAFLVRLWNSSFEAAKIGKIERIYHNGRDSGFYSVPCQRAIRYPEISFQWGNGTAWTMSTASQRRVPIGNDRCLWSLADSDNIDRWTLGTSFLSNVYTTLDYARSTVGFAKLR